ncbi:MAG: hypothetical protein AAB598_02705 [Patescibacteria group bacterium]
MVTRKTLFILIALGAIFFTAVCIGVFFFYQKMTPPAMIRGEKIVTAQAKYIKGGAAFFYPSAWQVNDIPASPGMISVQVVDSEDGIVLVASSAEKMSDSEVSGTLVREGNITVGGIAGKERRWENIKSQTVIFRADNLKFEGKQYRFELFGTLSRKVKMERAWDGIMKSVQFEKRSEEGITATPQEQQ